MFGKLDLRSTMMGGDLWYFSPGAPCISQDSQRNRTNRMYIYGKRFIIRNWLTWLWRLASPKVYRVIPGKPVRDDGLVLTLFCRSENQESQWYSSRLKAGRLQTQKKLMFQFQYKGRKKPVLQFEVHQAGGILTYLGEGQSFCCSQAFTGWDEDNLFYSLYQFKC